MEKEKNLLMMLTISLLMFIIAISIIFLSFMIKKEYTFKFPDNQIFINSKGIEEYSINRIRNKIKLIFSATEKNELTYFLQMTMDKTKLNIEEAKIKEEIINKKLLKKNIKILNIKKVYGTNIKIKGNKPIYKETSAEYIVSIKVNNLKDINIINYYKIKIKVNDKQEIKELTIIKDKNLKEFYEAIEISKNLTINKINALLTIRQKNRIFVRNLLIKPNGTKIIIEEVKYIAGQTIIDIKIDKNKYVLIYKKGKIINVIKNK